MPRPACPTATTSRLPSPQPSPVKVGERAPKLLRYLFAPFLVALSFLTLLPVGVREPTDAEISRSRGWYPFVGLLYGLLLVVLLGLCYLLVPRFALTSLPAALLVAAPALVNRFLHLDGLMDFCDAMWGGRTAERRLEIMRDSRVGSFAVAGCLCVLLVKFAALDSVRLTGWEFVALLLFPMVSRWTMTLLLTVFPYGRQQGIGSAFAQGNRPWLPTGLGLLSVAAAAWLLLGPAGVAVLIVVSLLALLLGWWSARRLGGGLTGDCYGAANEIMEAVTLTLLLALLSFPYFGFDPVHVGYGSGIVQSIPITIGIGLPPGSGGWSSYPGP